MARTKKGSKPTLKGYFFTGVLVTAPVVITLYVVARVFRFIDQQVVALIPAAYNPERYLPYGVPGLGIVLLLVFFVGVGVLSSNLIGSWFRKIGQGILRKTPIISGIYGALQKVFETIFSSDKTAAFRQAVLVEYPRKDLWTIAFVTGEVPKIIQKKGVDLISIYVPTTPNPTSGFLIYVPKKDVRFLDITVDEAFKLIISMGIVNPNQHKNLPAKTVKKR